MRHKPFLPQIAMTLLLAWCLGGESAEAEVRLSGTPDRVVLTTNDATMEEILAELRSVFDVEVKLQGGIARKFTGTYIGSVRQVLSRLLRGEDYVLRSTAEGVGIRLLGVSASNSAASPPSLVAASQGSRLVALRQGRVRRNGDNE
jgi:hypothetical protein